MGEGDIIPTTEPPKENGCGFQRKYKVKIWNIVCHVWLQNEFLVYAIVIKGYFLWKAQSREKAGNCSRLRLAAEKKGFRK